MFLDADVFQTITSIAEKGNFDIVEFKGIESKIRNKDILNNKIRDTSWCGHPLNLVLYQPQLGRYQTWPTDSLTKYRVESMYLWAKCFRTIIYKKAINKLGKEKYSRYILSYEDMIMNYALFNTARSYKFVGKYGVFHINIKGSASKIVTRVEYVIYHIYVLDVMLDFVQDRAENKRVLVNLVLFILSRKYLKQALKISKDIYNLFISCLDKILKMSKISEDLKDEIRKKGKQLKFINYNF